MICPLCQGRRLFFVHGQLLPCPECEGHGEIHCCDGLQEQTEAPEPPASPSGSAADQDAGPPAPAP
jgi:hypothetical protein